MQMNLSRNKVNLTSIIFSGIILCGTLLWMTNYNLTFDISEREHKQIIPETFRNPFMRRSNSTSPLLCVLVRTDGENLSYFPVFAFSLRHSGFDNIQLMVVNTNQQTNVTRLTETLNFINDYFAEHDFAKLLDLGPIPSVNQHGYGVTDQALQYLYDQYKRKLHSCRYLLVTNNNNLFSKNWAKNVFPHMLRRTGIIGWGLVSHNRYDDLKMNVSTNTKSIEKWFDDGTQKCLMPERRISDIDSAAFMYRFDLLYKHQLLYKIPNRPYTFTTDTEFFERFKRITDSIAFLRQTLLIHQ